MAELPQGRFDGRQEFRQWLRDALLVAARDGWHDLVFSDADFVDWPLGERAVVEALNAWAGPGRRLLVLARSYDEVVRRHARFVQWRVRFDHLVACHRCRDAEAQALPSLLAGPQWWLHRIDVPHCRGLAGTEAGRLRQLRQRLDEGLQRAVPGLPASVLGLRAGSSGADNCYKG